MTPALTALQWWLIDFQLAATLLLGTTLVSTRWIRQPAHRVMLGWATAIALALFAVATALPNWPRVEAVTQSLSPSGHDAALERSRLQNSHLMPEPFESSRLTTEPPSSSTASSGPLGQAPPVPAKTWGSAIAAVLSWARAGFLLGSVAVCLWLLLGALEAAWLCHTAEPAPGPLEQQLTKILRDHSRRPRLRTSSRVDNAVTLGLIRPTILLPARLAQQAEEQSVRAVLAHEAAHIQNRDLWLLGLMRCLLIVLYPHPLYWPLRRMIRASQEIMADAVAAGNRTSEYAGCLIAWMRQVAASEKVRAAIVVGIWEKRSELERRVAMLIDDQFDVQTHVGRHWRISAVASFALATLGLSLITVRPGTAANSAHPLESGRPSGPLARVEASAEVQSKTSRNQQGLSFTGRVIDKVSRKPVQNATVTVRRSIYSSAEHRVLEETKHQTDGEGQFRFSLTPEQAAHRYAYLEFEVTHPNYARHPWDGYGLRLIQKNEELGERPFFEKLELSPAEKITGVIARPDGTPASGVKVLAYSKANKENMAEYGSFAEAWTDAAGRFGLNVIKGGEAVLWLLPKEFVPSTHLLHQRRGDLGRFVLEDGIRLTGRVLDTEGKPVSSVWVNAELYGGPAKQNIGMPVADALGRSSLTDENGKFVMGPLPVGEYHVLISEYPRNNLAEDHSRHAVRDVFLHRNLELQPGQASQAIEIRAAPYVTLGIRQLDGQGRPFKTHAVHVSGHIGDGGWWGEGPPDENGHILLKVPKGLSEARIEIGLNEHQAARFRWSSDAPLRNEREITLGTLREDARDIAIFYYTAPVLLVKAVGENGAAVRGFKCQVVYSNDSKPYDRPPRWISGVEGDVYFEKQEDGRWRSQQLLPDESFLLTVEAEGFQPWSQRLTVPAAKTEEVEAKLQKQ